MPATRSGLRSPQSDAPYASRCIAANLRLIVDGAYGCCSRAIRYRVTTVLLKASRGIVLRHGQAHATKGLNAFGTSLTRNSLSLRAAGAIRSGCNGCGQRFRWRDLICGLIEPGFETRLAESRAIAGKESLISRGRLRWRKMRSESFLATTHRPYNADARWWSSPFLPKSRQACLPP
jgi:hypothetical protein